MPLRNNLYLWRVPVLSVHNIYSAEVLDGWKAFHDDLLSGHGERPFARFTVTIMGHLRVRPTAIERPKRSASTQLPLVIPTIKNTAQTMTTMNRIMSQVKERTPMSKLVSSRRSVRRWDIEPNMVLVPVFTTTPRAVPLVTLLPKKQALGSSNAAVWPPDPLAPFRQRLTHRREQTAYEKVLRCKKAQSAERSIRHAGRQRRRARPPIPLPPSPCHPAGPGYVTERAFKGITVFLDRRQDVGKPTLKTTMALTINVIDLTDEPETRAIMSN